jgi:hypothetical protein
MWHFSYKSALNIPTFRASKRPLPASLRRHKERRRQIRVGTPIRRVPPEQPETQAAALPFDIVVENETEGGATDQEKDVEAATMAAD